MTAFPLSAVVGQEALVEALLACAVDPAIGGVLVRGERGTAKSTAVRALAPLMPAVDVVPGDPYSLAADDPEAPAGERVERPVRLVELPVGATADRLVGTLDLDRALAVGARAFQPGLLAAAHRGILYVDEVNLLPDHLVDVLLDAAAMGRNHVERDGISVAHPARFVLVGTMNPEEGELRPQLTDRFGLSVAVAASLEPAARVEVVRRRLAFDAAPEAFAARFASSDRALAERIAAARERLGAVRLPDRMLLLVAGTCARLGVDGMRADIVCARTACALAALDGATEVGEEHVRRAALLALAHRRRRGPLDPPGLDPSALDDAMDQARGDADPDDEGPGGGDSPGRGDDPEGGATPDEGAAPSRSDDAASRDGGALQPASQATRHDGTPPLGERDGADTTSAEPGGEALEPGRAQPRAEPRDAREEGGADGRPAPFAVAPERREQSGAAGHPPLLELLGRGRGAVGRRSRAAGPHGAPVDARAPEGPVTDLAAAATLRAAALRTAAARGQTPHRNSVISAEDLREHVRAGREGNLVVFCVDASGSMGARRRMAAVKGAVLGLLLDAYQRRDRVALVSFRGDGAELVLAPTGSVDRAAAALEELVTGGVSPIAVGLERTAELLAAERRRDPDRRALVVVVTDGRASGGRAGRDAAERAAARLARAADGVVVFDAEEGAVRLGLAGALAEAAGARLLPLEALNPPVRSAA